MKVRRRDKLSRSSLCHSTEVDKREITDCDHHTRPADEHTAFRRATSPLSLMEAVASMPNRTKELDMNNSNPFIRNRHHANDAVTLILVTASLVIAGFALALPLIAALIARVG